MIVQSMPYPAAASDPTGPDIALVRKATGQIVSTVLVTQTWDAEEFDSGNRHDNVTNNSRLNTVAGDELVRIISQSLISTSASFTVTMEQNRSVGGGAAAAFAGEGYGRSSATGAINVCSALLPVTNPGTDYLTNTIVAGSGNFTPGAQGETWFYLEHFASTLPYVTLTMSGNQLLTTNVANALIWGAASGSKASWWSAGDPTKVTPDETLVRITGNIVENNVSSNTFVRVLKNGAVARGLPARKTNNSGADAMNFASAPIAMNGTTDYLQVSVTPAGAASILAHNGTWVQVEKVIEPATYQRALLYKTSNQNLPAGVTGRIYWDAANETTAILQTISSTVTITIASPGVVQWVAHGLSNNDPVKFSTTGALPTGITAGTIYYVLNKTNDTFQLAASPGGAAINTSGAQSGTHTCTNKSKALAPSGVSEVRIVFGLTLSASTSGIDFANTISQCYVQKNAASFNGMPFDSKISAAGQTRQLGAWTGWLPVTALTDLFSMLTSSTGQARDVVADEFCFLSLEFR